MARGGEVLMLEVLYFSQQLRLKEPRDASKIKCVKTGEPWTLIIEQTWEIFADANIKKHLSSRESSSFSVSATYRIP